MLHPNVRAQQPWMGLLAETTFKIDQVSPLSTIDFRLLWHKRHTWLCLKSACNVNMKPTLVGMNVFWFLVCVLFFVKNMIDDIKLTLSAIQMAAWAGAAILVLVQSVANMPQSTYATTHELAALAQRPALACQCCTEEQDWVEQVGSYRVAQGSGESGREVAFLSGGGWNRGRIGPGRRQDWQR